MDVAEADIASFAASPGAHARALARTPAPEPVVIREREHAAARHAGAGDTVDQDVEAAERR